MIIKQAIEYRQDIIDLGGKLYNIKNWRSHFLYGTSVQILVNLSKRGIVNNPRKD